MRKLFTLITLIMLIGHCVAGAEELTATSIKDKNADLEDGIPAELPDGTKIEGKDARINSDGSIDCSSTCKINGKDTPPGKGIRANADGTWSAPESSPKNNKLSQAQSCSGLDPINCASVQEIDSSQGMNAEGATGVTLGADSFSFAHVDSLSTETYSMTDAVSVSSNGDALTIGSAREFNVEHAGSIETEDMNLKDIGPSIFKFDEGLSYARIQSATDNNLMRLKYSEAELDRLDSFNVTRTGDGFTLQSANNITFRAAGINISFGKGTTLDFDYGKGVTCMNLGKSGEINLKDTRFGHSGPAEEVCMEQSCTDCSILDDIAFIRADFTVSKLHFGEYKTIISTGNGFVRFTHDEFENISIRECVNASLYSDRFEINCTNPLLFRFNAIHPATIIHVEPKTDISAGKLVSGKLRMFTTDDAWSDYYTYIAKVTGVLG